MRFRPLLPAVLVLAGVVVGGVQPGALRAAPSLEALQTALNTPGPGALGAVLEAGPGLNPQEVEARQAALRQRFPDARWTVRPGTPLRDGRSTTEVVVQGTRQLGAYAFRFEARQQLVLGGSAARFNRQQVIRESSMLRSGDADLGVSLLIPDAVLTGQRYDLDVIFDDPLEGSVAAGAIKSVSGAELISLETPDLELEALGGGGLFKTVQAPYQPGTQTWAVLLVHPKGIVSATKQVRVVADQSGLNL